MYIVIVGAGRIGRSLARWLVAADHEVAVVEQDSSRCAALEDELGGVSVVGDGTAASTLAKAGVNRAEVFIAATGRDDQNLMACQLARHRFGASRTASIVHIPDHERLFNLLGIDIVVSTTDPVVARIQEALSGVLSEGVENPA